MRMNDTEFDSNKCDKMKVSDCNENWKFNVKKNIPSYPFEIIENVENVTVTCGKL